MPKEILLLTGPAEAPRLSEYLREHNGTLAVTPAATVDALEAACRRPLEGVRLVAFATSVIVPAWVLRALPSPAYNFHPGPPTHPGSHGVSFALHEGVQRFGATVHAMNERVDEGTIVGVEWFDVPPGIDRFGLEVKTYEALARLFLKLARPLATSDAPLPPAGVAWSGRKRTRKDYARMRRIAPGMDAAEVERRRRAFGEE